MVGFMATNYGVGLVARNDWPHERRVADLRPLGDPVLHSQVENRPLEHLGIAFEIEEL
jgi:hypothetical protein